MTEEALFAAALEKPGAEHPMLVARTRRQDASLALRLT